MKKLFIYSLIGCMLSPIIASTVVQAETVAGLKSLNNFNKYIDYKTNSSQLSKSRDNINISSSILEEFMYNQSKDLSGLSSEASYLIDNNIISRKEDISASKDDVSVNTMTLPGNSEVVNKSDFLMGIYKSKFGVIPSRPLVFNTNATRVIDGQAVSMSQSSSYTPIGYKGSSKTFDFREGDYYVYYNPNVYELYLSELLDKGVIYSSEIKDLNFMNEYKSKGTTSKGLLVYPQWYNSLKPKVYLSENGNNDYGVSLLNGSVLGKGYALIEVNKFTSNEQIDLKSLKPDFFFSESITTIEALRYIEKLVRLTEKDMTYTEAKIVSYKYGVSYLNNLPEEDRKTVTFLVAKGILNFENRSEFGSLYSDLNNSMFRTLLYRLANTNARLDFSKIELTDSDNFWLEKGFNQTTLKFYDTPTYPTSSTISVTEEKKVSVKEKTKWEKFLNFFGVETSSPSIRYATGEADKYFTIEKSFSSNVGFFYKGIELSKLSTGGEIKAIRLDNKIYYIQFYIKAPTIESALVLLDSNIQVDAEKMKVGGSIGSVTKMVGDKQLTLVSGSELRKTLSEIEIVQDKVLRNRITGTMAILLQDANIALVGNNVINSEDLMVFSANKEVYYNLEIILSLMSNAYISGLDPNSIYVCRNMATEKYVPVKSSTGVEIQKDSIATFKEMTGGSNAITDKTMFNLSTMSIGLTTLIKDYSITRKDNTKGEAKLIVDWKYVLPPSDTQFSGIVNDPNPSIKSMSEFLFTRPNESLLARWWDSNIGISNALCNMIYGTKDVEYIRSGYLAPSITVLCSELDENEVKTKMFSDIVFSPVYSANFLTNNPTNFLDVLFNKMDSTTLYGNLAQSRKYQTYFSKRHSDGYVDYGGKYVITPGGAIFKDVSEDERVDLNNDILYLKTRSSEIKSFPEGKEVTFNGKSYFYDGIEGGSSMSRYFRLVSKDVVMGGVYSPDTKNYSLGDHTKDLLISYLTDVTKDLSGEAFMIPSDISKLSKFPLRTYLQSGVYIAEGKLYKCTDSGTSITPMDYKGSIPLAYAHPVLYLDRAQFTIKDDKIVPLKTYPYLQNGNIFYSGINNAMIDSMIAKSVKSTKINDLKDGDRVIIGDATYIKSGNALISVPLKNTALNNNIRENPNKAKETILKFYSGMNLDYSRRPVSFTSYITEAGLGNLPDSIEGTKTLVNNNGLKVKDGTKFKNYGPGEIFTSVCITIKVDDNVYCRILDESTNTYILLSSTERYSEGYIDNVPFFTESLGITLRDDIYLQLDRVKYNPLYQAKKLMEEFKRLFALAFRGDLLALFKLLCIGILSYLIVISWVCFCVLNFGVGKQFLEILKNPQRTSDSKGFDTVKFISFGLYSLDNNIQSSRLFVSNLMMFLLIFVVMKYL